MKFYDQVHYIKAKFASQCPECLEKIEKGEDIVYMSDFKIAIHHNCFYKPVKLFDRDPLSLYMEREEKPFINLDVCPEQETAIYQFRVKDLSVLNRREIL